MSPKLGREICQCLISKRFVVKVSQQLFKMKKEKTPLKEVEVGKPCEPATHRCSSQMTKNHMKHIGPSDTQLYTNIGFLAKLSPSHLTKEDMSPKQRFTFRQKGKGLWISVDRALHSAAKTLTLRELRMPLGEQIS